jgi:multidrug resistance efflux pump
VLVAAVAIVFGRALWNVYMATPWTRDGTVRADIVTMAPEVAGRIVSLPVADNQFVHKDDLLMIIDPTNYKIALGQAKAAVQQSQANVQNIDAQLSVQQAQISANQAQVAQVQAALDFARWQAQHYQALVRQDSASVQSAQQYASQQRQQEAALESAQANLKLSQQQVDALNAQRASAEANLAQVKQQLSQAEVNLERTRILSPVDGYVTNLLSKLGNYVNVGVNIVSVVDANSFWVDGYFEETNLAPIRVGDPARMKLMGYDQIMRGHVDSVARAINVANAQPNNQGVATVNPIFTWVRLAQRIPVRIHVDEVPQGIILTAGMTATVQIDPRPSAQ